jgi:hypothetical protein
MDVKLRVWPVEHPLGLVFVEEAAAHEEPEPATGDRQHHLAVGHRREQRLVQPEAPPGDPFGVTTRAEVPGLTGEREKILVGAGVAVDPGEAVPRRPQERNWSTTLGMTARQSPWVEAIFGWVYFLGKLQEVCGGKGEG